LPQYKTSQTDRRRQTTHRTKRTTDSTVGQKREAEMKKMNEYE